MINKSAICNFGLTFVDEYSFDDTHSSFVFKKDNTCIIVDNNICENDKEVVFDYSKYCEMQNKYMAEYEKLYRFNFTSENIYTQIYDWLNKTPADIEIKDNGGSFDNAHLDNTPLEKTFEDLFVESYGDNATEYLKKEYSVSLNNGRNAFIDYVVETKNGNYAIEENGVHYHHPCLIGNNAYERQLEKQNTLVLYGFKVFRFSSQNLSFKEQTIDNIKSYLGEKDNFINSVVVKEQRKFKLYEHQERILEEFRDKILKGSTWNKQEEVMKFDAIVGNPPYNEIVEKDVDNTSASKQLFPDFIITSINLGPNYVTLITPSRWFVGGEQAGYFPKLRKFLKENNHISKLVHYPNHKEVFDNVNIPGGISYFLYEFNYTGLVNFVTVRNNKNVSEKRKLFEDGFDIVFADSKIYNIIKKVTNNNFIPFNTIVGEWNSFGIVGRKDILLNKTTTKSFEGAIKLQCAYEEIRYTKLDNITKNRDILNHWKVFTSKGNGGAGTLQDDKPVSIIGKSYVAEPMMACTDSLIPIGNFNSKDKAVSLCKYMKTKFLRFMVGVLKVSQNIYQNVYKLVPLQEFSDKSDIDWSKSIPEIDQQLYKKYNLTEEEINFIESKIKPME